MEGFVDVLNLYNERAAELNESVFLRTLRSNPSSFQFRGGPFRVERVGGPDAEAIRAFLLTFRLFVQDGDGLSFRNISDRYDTLPVSSELRTELASIRRELNEFLDGMTPFDFCGERVSRRDLMHTWLYGQLAHVNPNHRSRLKRWTVAADTAPLVQGEFDHIVAAVTQSIFWVRQVNLRALQELAGPTSRWPSNVAR